MGLSFGFCVGGICKSMSGTYRSDLYWRGNSESLLSRQVVDKTMGMTLMEASFLCVLASSQWIRKLKLNFRTMFEIFIGSHSFLSQNL